MKLIPAEYMDVEAKITACSEQIKSIEDGKISTVVIVSPVEGKIICPKCGSKQMANRNRCWHCGVNFEFK